MNKLAKALYDNTAECADELAFRKGDIVVVLDQHVAGTSGWWMCSLYGRHGLAPANRLQLLLQRHAGSAPSRPEIPPDDAGDDRMQNIYQVPVVPRPSSSPAYERMDMIYEVPSAPLAKGPTSEGVKNSLSSPGGEVYDVPNQARQVSAFTASTTPRHMSRKHSLIPISELEKRFDPSDGFRCSSPGDSYVYAVPPPLAQDPNYDIPVPSATEEPPKTMGGYNTLPNLRKTEWIYDVPASPEKPSQPPGSCGTVSKGVCWPLYDTFPARVWPVPRKSPTPSLYDIPRPSSLEIVGSPKDVPVPTVSGKLPAPSDESVYAVPPKEERSAQPPSDSPVDHIPLECRGDSNDVHELSRVRLQRMRNFLAYSSFHDLPGIGESLARDDGERGRVLRLSAADSQRISTASSSSTSSCDSLALSSSSPEPLRELALSQDEACRRLLDLQECVCKAVPRLMEFVSSHWRSREHLQKHLTEIKEAAEGIASSLTCFLNFALDIKGNARRLTDANLQARLYKQLSIIEDSGVILQQTVSALNAAGWPLNLLSQDPGQVQTPDQLERFVMVARTIPEDVKRLVSIVIANGKLLFRPTQRDPEPLNTTGPPETKESPSREEQGGDSLEDDNDYVVLQTKNEFELRQNSLQSDPKGTTMPDSTKAQADEPPPAEPPSTPEDPQSPCLSEHCRLYFGALQKAICGFIGSIQDGQPPEKFILQGKLVIMVGQRLVDTLCKEAQRGGSSQSLLLCKSNHLCALLKQLAMATKKAVLHFPDKQALREAQEFAKELAQRAQHFRISLEL